MSDMEQQEKEKYDKPEYESANFCCIGNFISHHKNINGYPDKIILHGQFSIIIISYLQILEIVLVDFKLTKVKKKYYNNINEMKSS